jgi:hypothetical protein
MAYKLIHFSLLLSFGISSWIQNQSPMLIRPFDARSAALGGINSFEKSDRPSVRFSYSSSNDNIFEESSIIFHKGNRSYYFSYFGVPDLDNTTNAWSDNGDGSPTADEIDYTRITLFDYRSISFTYPLQISTSKVDKYFSSKLEIWPIFSFSSLHEELAYSAGFSMSKSLNFDNVQFLLFVHDIISGKWWSTNRKELYRPFLELIINSNYDKTTLLIDGILNNSEINGKFGLSFHIHKNLSLRGGYESGGIFSLGTGIKMKFIELDIAVVSSGNEHPFKPTQQFTLILLTEEALSAAKGLSP